MNDKGYILTPSDVTTPPRSPKPHAVIVTSPSHSKRRRKSRILFDPSHTVSDVLALKRKQTWNKKNNAAMEFISDIASKSSLVAESQINVLASAVQHQNIALEKLQAQNRSLNQALTSATHNQNQHEATRKIIIAQTCKNKQYEAALYSLKIEMQGKEIQEQNLKSIIQQKHRSVTNTSIRNQFIFVHVLGEHDTT